MEIEMTNNITALNIEVIEMVNVSDDFNDTSQRLMDIVAREITLLNGVHFNITSLT